MQQFMWQYQFETIYVLFNFAIVILFSLLHNEIHFRLFLNEVAGVENLIDEFRG